MRRAALTFLALAIVSLAVAPAQAKDGGKVFDVAVLQCVGNEGGILVVDAVSLTSLEVIEIGSMCGDALKTLQDAGYETDSTVSRNVTFTYTLTRNSK